MKVRFLLLTAVALVVSNTATDGTRWWAHIEYLADDKLEGRDVGSAGFEKAVAYVAGQFETIGLKPAGTSGYRQPVKFESRRLVPDQSGLALARDGQEQPIVLGQDASLSARSELAGSVEASMVFVGYGVSIPESKWDDLAGVDLRGKIAVYVNMPVPADAPDNVKSHFGSAVERWAALKRAGAIGVATLPNLRTPATDGAADRAPQPTVNLFDKDLQDLAGQVVAMTITRGGAAKFLAGSGHSLDELEQLAIANKPLPRFPLAGTLRARATIERSILESTNVVGVFEGSDPDLKSEYVVMSAHLDHLGIGQPVNGDSIYNGAMDDASGVASVIEIARLLKESGGKPKRSILFLAHTAEEKGLLGSRYFAARPTVPPAQIVADINLDMFLPLYPLKVIEVQGLTESSLGESVRAAAKELSVDVQTDREPEQNRFIRSDQYSFIRRGIPSLAFKFGYEPGSPEEKIRRDWVRDVYHKPADDLAQPVDLDAAAKFNRVIMGLLQRVANDSARPAWHDGSFFKRFAPASAAAAQTPAAAPAPRPCAGCGIAPEPIAREDVAGWTQIFDGKTLHGWDGNPDVWKAENGAITAESTAARRVASTFIIWRGGEPADFELKLEIKADFDIHSGVFYRGKVGAPPPRAAASGSTPARPAGATAGRPPQMTFAVPPDPRWNVYGYGLDFDYGPENDGNVQDTDGRTETQIGWRGHIVRMEPGKRPRVVGLLGDRDALMERIKPGEWNRVHIIAHGNQLTHIVNDQVLAMLIDDDAGVRKSRGVIALQIEQWGTGRINFRNIWLKQ